MAKSRNDVAFIFSSGFSQYHFAKDHPFDSRRALLTKRLLEEAGALNSEQIHEPKQMDDSIVQKAHQKNYLAFVKEASRKGADNMPERQDFGLGTEDTPIFKGMHESACLVAQATWDGLHQVMGGQRDHCLNLSGGLHHATVGRASGFCVYNDVNIAIADLVSRYDVKVMYIDTDAHHGDGVQWHFYDDPRVCTVSIHETGKFLFPGTGNVRERGHEKGYGFNFNIPIEPFTEDESFLFLLENALYVVAEYFKPDIIVSQHGADGHFLDEMSHLSLTMETYRYIPKLIHKIAHEYAGGKWMAVGGGGYNVFDVVPRSWAMVWMVMNDWPLPQGPLPPKWIREVEEKTNHKVHASWEDDFTGYMPIPRKEEIKNINKKTLINSLYPINEGELGNDFFRKYRY